MRMLSKKEEAIYIEARLEVHKAQTEYYMEKCNMNKGAASAAALRDIQKGWLDNDINEIFNDIKKKRSGKR